MSSRVLVTGGSGFIGSHVVDQLLAAGLRVRNFDMVESPYHNPGDIDFYLGDLSEVTALADAMTGCDVVVHLAAVADVSQVVLDPVFAEAVNARGTLNVLEAARQTGVDRVVYASTIWVYDGLEGASVDETTPLAHPNHLYTATKLAGETYCTAYAELYGVEYTILRFGIPYGPRARSAAVLPQFVRKALAGEPLRIAGAGDQSRRFVYVEDLAKGCVAALAPQAANRVFNLVGREDTSVLEIARIIGEIVRDVDLEFVESRAGDFRGAEVSPDRALSELGWQAETPFAQGVQSYLAWYLEQHPGTEASPGETAH